MKTAVRILLWVMLCAALFAVVIIIAGGGFGDKKKPELIYPGNQSMLLFAHRGLGNYFPENSMEGFEASITHGFKALETDIRLTADDTLVIFHDENCMRLIGIDTVVSKLPASELIQSHIIFNGTPSGSTVITLADLFGSIRNRLVIYLDVKIHDTGTADKIAALIKKYNLESSTIVANSNMLFIAWLEFRHPEINTVLEGFNPGKEWLYACIPVHFKPDFFASFAGEVNPQHMEWIRSKGLTSQRIVYGVSHENFRQTESAGIQKMIVDYDSTLQEAITKYR